MRQHALLTPCLIAGAIASGENPAAAQGTSQGVIAITHVAVIPMDRERVLRGQTLIIDGDRIVAVGPSKRPLSHGVRARSTAATRCPRQCSRRLYGRRMSITWESSAMACAPWDSYTASSLARRWPPTPRSICIPSSATRRPLNAKLFPQSCNVFESWCEGELAVADASAAVAACDRALALDRYNQDAMAVRRSLAAKPEVRLVSP